MKRFLSKASCGIVLAVSLLLPFAGVAPAGASTGVEASVSGTAVDAWQIVGDSVNALLGTTSCTISASSPVNNANLVAGSGSVACNKTFAKLTLTVCIQAKQPFVDDGGATWEDIGCAPTKAQLNASSLSATATAACVPGPMLYRTRAVSEGFRADSSEPAFSAMIQSASRLYDCFL